MSPQSDHRPFCFRTTVIISVVKCFCRFYNNFCSTTILFVLFCILLSSVPKERSFKFKENNSVSCFVFPFPKERRAYILGLMRYDLLLVVVWFRNHFLIDSFIFVVSCQVILFILTRYLLVRGRQKHKHTYVLISFHNNLTIHTLATLSSR